jgi:hypothetical protein
MVASLLVDSVLLFVDTLPYLTFVERLDIFPERG